MGAVTMSNPTVELFEDFVGKAGGVLPTWLLTSDAGGGAGSPTLDYVTSELNGAYELTHDSQSEAQRLTLYGGDSLCIDPTKGPVLEARVSLDAIFTADQRLVVGFGSALNASLDAIASNAWFRVEGADLSVFYESDDGTTDTDDNDSGVDLVADTYINLKVDMTDLSYVEFSINGKLVGTTSCAALTASNKLQPYIEMQKDSGADIQGLSIDSLYVRYVR